MPTPGSCESFDFALSRESGEWMPRLDECVGWITFVDAGTLMFFEAAGFAAFLLETEETGEAEADAAAEEGSEKEKLLKWLLEPLLLLLLLPPGLLPMLSS